MEAKPIETLTCGYCGKRITDENPSKECGDCGRPGCEECMPGGVGIICENCEFPEDDDED